MKQMPLKLETDFLLMSHADLSGTKEPFDENNNDSVCWNRKPLIHIGKLQVHGHTPLKGKPALYTPANNSWNIDTAAAYGYGLSTLRINKEGEVTAQLFVKTDSRDTE